MPSKDLHSVLYQDIIEQMENLEKRNYSLPKDYDKRKHDISDNEMRLFEQQVQRDRHRDTKKVSEMIGFSAITLSQLCQLFQVDWIKTKNLPKIIREAINEGEFEDCMEGIGQYMRGTVFDNPLFSTVLKFVEKVGEAHTLEVEEEQEQAEEDAHKRERNHADALRSLNKLRQPAVPITADLPKPKKKLVHEKEEEKKEKKSKSRPKEKVEIKKSEIKKSEIKQPEEQIRPKYRTVKIPKTPNEKKEKREEKEEKEQKIAPLEQKITPLEQKINDKKPIEIPPETPQQKTEKTEITETTEQKPILFTKKKKGFKKCNTLVLPSGIDKIMQVVQEPMKEMKAMLSEESRETPESLETQEKPKFHNLSF